MRVPVVLRWEQETALRRALERGEFLLHYQPVVELTTGRVVGVEVLIRWQHPEQGVLAPTDFVGLAEETGLIVPLGRWALAEACGWLRRWQDDHRPRRPLSMSVNLSSRQIQRPDLAGEVEGMLDRCGLDPSWLTLEITESVAMADAPETWRTLRALRQLGVRLAIDDFGIGYSSLRSLRQLPLDALKIDGSFVAGLGQSADDLAIVGAITTLAHDLGLTVTAEGVETAEQVDRLREIGVDHVQGFFFAQPASGEVIGGLLDRSVRLPEGSAAGAPDAAGVPSGGSTPLGG